MIKFPCAYYKIFVLSGGNRYELKISKSFNDYNNFLNRAYCQKVCREYSKPCVLYGYDYQGKHCYTREYL